MKKGEPKSKAHQLVIIHPIDGSILTNPVKVTTQKPQTRKCYVSNYGAPWAPQKYTNPVECARTEIYAWKASAKRYHTHTEVARALKKIN